MKFFIVFRKPSPLSGSCPLRSSAKGNPGFAFLFVDGILSLPLTAQQA
jgi:hypothetical protein